MTTDPSRKVVGFWGGRVHYADEGETPPRPRSRPSPRPAPAPESPVVARRLALTPASDIAPRPVVWAWQDRLPLGSLALLAGREGTGKSTVAYQLAADVTRGTLPGVNLRTPKAVIVAATEDSWEHTIVPRLMAARADLDRVYRVDVITSDDVTSTLSLPRDLTQTERAICDVDAALVLLDPLMSRLSATLDTHRDGDVRQALEPLVRIADRTGAAVLGIIHLNKSGGTDPLTAVMASRAFVAVARAVLFVMRDPDDEEKAVRLLGQPKNNLGRDDLPTLTFRIETAHVADTDEGAVTTGRLVWGYDTDRSIQDVLEAAGDDADARSATVEAGEWLVDYLMTQGGEASSKDVKVEGGKAGHSIDSLKRARRRLRLPARAVGYPRSTVWSLPGAVLSEQPKTTTSRSSPGESAPTALTAPTGQSVQSVQSESGPPRDAPTARLCTSCGEPMTAAEEGRTTHPRCTPDTS